MSNEPIVEMHDISIEFPGVKALDGVDFRLLPGEVHALMGENGAGKSTLIKALTGVYTIDAGTISMHGRPVSFSGTADARDAGISVVYQEVNLCPNLSVGENVMLGREKRGRFGINWSATHRAAAATLAKLGLHHLDTRAPLSTLSLAVQQLVAISRTMVTDPSVLILDEPTSSLDAAEVERLFTVIRRLRDEGVAILFVSHFLDQIYEISDRITVLRNGQYVGEYLVADLDRADLIAHMIGKELTLLRSIEAARDQPVGARSDQALLVADGIGRAGGVEATDLELFAGEVAGFAGLLGSGRTELARLLAGADRSDTGELRMRGSAIDLGSPTAGLEQKIAYSSENRRDEGVIGELTVRENLILGVQARRGWMRPMSRREQSAIVDKYIAELGVRPTDPEIPIKNLSGGNQQKVLLGRWLATRPDLLILDEPTRGIDIGAKAEIQALVIELRDAGVSVVFISSEIDEVVRLSDRVIVMKDRRKIDEIDVVAGTTADDIVSVIAGDVAV